MQQVYSDNFGNMLMLPKLGPSLNPYCCLSALMKLGSAGLAKPTLPPPRPPPAPAPRPRPGILTEILQFVYKAPFQTKKTLFYTQVKQFYTEKLLRVNSGNLYKT